MLCSALLVANAIARFTRASVSACGFWMCTCRVQHAPLPFGPHVFVAAWVMQQLVDPIVYFEALLNLHHISWGRRRFRLQWGAQATLEPSQDRARASSASARA